MKEIKWKKDVNDCCPYCGCEEYYYYQTVYGKVLYAHSFAGHEVDNGDMYDSLMIKDPIGYVKCRFCHKIIGKFS